MDNTITALQNLYVALGGTRADVADIVLIPDMVNAIATQATTVVAAANAKELPTVSAETDNGKVLTVVEGAWAKANLPETNAET